MRSSSCISMTFLGLVLWLASVSSGQAQSLEWAKRAGGTDFERGHDIAVDTSGNSYVTGIFQGTATFGPGEANETVLTTAGFFDIFVAKYDSKGLLVWAKRAGGPDFDWGNGIAVDSSGNSYVTGSFRDPATFGPGEANETVLTSGSQDLFVAKYDNTGLLVWAKQTMHATNGSGNGIAVDNSGNSYVTGSFEGTATFGAGEANETVLTSGVSQDIFVAKYDSSGLLEWAKQVGGTDFEEGNSIAVDSSGNSVVTGRFQGTATFGPGEANQTMLTTAGSVDIFVAKYDSSGLLEWAKQAGGTAGDAGSGIAVDGSGNSYVTGTFEGTATFGAGEANETVLTSGVSQDIFVAKYDGSGSLVWAKQTVGPGGEVGSGIAVDGSGNSYVTGSFRDTATFGAGEANETILTATGISFDYDIFVAKYGSGGLLVWAKRAGATEFTDSGNGIAVDSSGNSVVTGDFAGTATFGPGEANQTMLTYAGFQDIFVAKFGAAGCGNGIVESGEQCDDGNTVNGDGCSATCQDEIADLAVTKAAPSTLLIQIGGEAKLTYTIGVQNTGPGGASGVLLSDPLPAGTTFVSASPSQGKCSTPPVGAGGTVNCSLGALSNGASATITLRVRVRGGLLGGLLGIRTITNTATVSAATVDPNSVNNAATAQTLVVTVLTQ